MLHSAYELLIAIGDDMVCPHCNKTIGMFSKEMNRFGRDKICPNCGKSVRLIVSFKVLGMLLIPAVLLIFILKQMLVKYGVNPAMVTGVVTGLTVVLSLRLKRV